MATYTTVVTLVAVLTVALMAAKWLVKLAADTKPHLMFTLVDKWGWANVGYHRDPPTKEVVMPNIDNLGKNRLQLDQHYAYKIKFNAALSSPCPTLMIAYSCSPWKPAGLPSW